MNKKVVAAVVISVPFIFPAVANADSPGTGGQGNATNTTPCTDTSTGCDSVGLVSVFSHQLKDAGSSLGDHSNNFAPGQKKADGASAVGRVGVGNLGRTDPFDGTSANSHFSGQLVAAMGQEAADLPPGNNDNPNRQGNPNG